MKAVFALIVITFSLAKGTSTYAPCKYLSAGGDEQCPEATLVGGQQNISICLTPWNYTPECAAKHACEGGCKQIEEKMFGRSPTHKYSHYEYTNTGDVMTAKCCCFYNKDKSE